ncbi:hypothetical protein BJX76DRAFT_367632 [Aspergillus varians]
MFIPDYFQMAYSVSPDRRIYEATKKAKERRFLCSRKQLSGGLFTDYNHSRPRWKAAEERLVQLFLGATIIWRNGKSPLGQESENRALLRECAAHLTQTMQLFFAEEINPHLFLLAQKLGKTQKLAYSRMGNNCQDFCNGLLNYDSYYHPMFSAMYPFIPVSVSPDIEQRDDDRCLSYLQSFVRPLQYPVPGSSMRAMMGSAVTMYSSYAQNDADLIDHVYSVRFGLGTQGQGDPYLLKDEEMSCSDRYTWGQSPANTGKPNTPCSLSDHLLDCPVDNLSILQTHLHRQKKYYTDHTNGEFLTNLPPAAWITNRLQILRRLKLLHDFLAEIAAHFQECCRMALPPGVVVDVKTLRKTWRPAATIFSRAWHIDKRVGNTLHYARDMDFGSGGVDDPKSLQLFALGMTDELFLTRVGGSGKEDEAWVPWEWCTCDSCKVHRLKATIIFGVDVDGADAQQLRRRMEEYTALAMEGTK